MSEGPTLSKKTRNKGFEALSRETIQGILQADALAIWTLLSSKPSGWIIRRIWVKDQLKIGDERYRKGVKRLRDVGLWKVVRVQDSKGKMCGSKIELFDEILESMCPPNRDMDEPTSRETESSETTSAYYIKNSKYKKNINPAPLVPNKNSSIEHYQNEMGVEFTPQVLALDDPRKIYAIVTKYKLLPEDIRTVFAEYSANIEKGGVRDKRALFIGFATRAENKNLNLSKEGEKCLPSWV